MLLLVFGAFISIGFPDAVLGVAWPEMQQAFARSRADLGIILFSTAAGYALSGAIGGSIIDRFGVGKTLAVSTLLVSLGLGGYAAIPGFWFAPVCAAVVGFGSGAVDTGLNSYAAQHYSTRVMSWLHAFFGIGAMIGPVIMAQTLRAGATWRIGYAIVASVTLLLGVIFVLRMQQWGDDTATPGEQLTRQRPREVLRQPLVWLQIGLFFGMVGIESGVGAWTTTLLRDRFAESTASAGMWTGAYWGAVTAGRILIPIAFRRVPTARVVQGGAWTMLAGTMLMLPDAAWMTKVAVIVFGLGSAPMFPNLMTLTPHRFGRAVAIHAIGYQVSAATIAAAVVPTVAGLISERAGVVAIPVVLAVVAMAVVLLEGVLRSRTSHVATVH